MKVLPLTQIYSAKLGHSPYQDSIEGENKGRHKCTNGIGKVNRNIATYKDKQSSQSIDHQKPVTHEI